MRKEKARKVSESQLVSKSEYLEQPLCHVFVILKMTVFQFKEFPVVTQGFSALAALQNHLGALKKQGCLETQPGPKIQISEGWV